jgi:hypothetical protein
MNKKLWLLLGISLLLVIGLLSLVVSVAPQKRGVNNSKSPTEQPAQAKIVHHEVLPSQTDPKINKPDFPHEVDVNANGAGDLLFIYIPGTGGRASNVNKLLMMAVDAGYHAISIDYDSNHSADQVCGNDPDCYGPLRREMLNGLDESPKIAVDSDNCIINRIRKLLAWLDAQYPNERWGQLLSGGHVIWNKVTVSGLSQGGGHAAMLGKLFELHRVVMFSSVVDGVNGPNWKSASWITQQHPTPSDRYYGFAETNDHKYFPRIKVNWETLALPGNLTSVDNNAPPYDNSHRLFSSRQGQDPHAQVVRDSLTPLDANGNPVYEPVWRYLIGP